MSRVFMNEEKENSEYNKVGRKAYNEVSEVNGLPEERVTC